MMKLTGFTSFDDLKSSRDTNQKINDSSKTDLKEIEELADFLRSHLIVKEKNIKKPFAYGR